MANKDGSERQEIILKCKIGDEVFLEPDPTARRKNTIRVLTSTKEQLGTIDYELAGKLFPVICPENKITAKIAQITSGWEGTIHGAFLNIQVPDGLIDQTETDTEDEKSKRTKIVGVSKVNSDGRSRQEIIRKFLEPEEVLLLKRETQNQYDENAIAVYVAPLNDPWHQGPYQIGYLSANLAAELAPKIDSGYRIIASVSEITGGEAEKETLGVNVLLEIFTPEEVAKNPQSFNSISQFQSAQPQPVSRPIAPVYPQSTLEVETSQPNSAAAFDPSKWIAKKRVLHSTSPRSSKNFFVLLTLWFFVGYLGAHRIYAGRGSWLYTLTFGYLLIGWMIDLIVIVVGQFKDGRGLPIRPI